MARNGRIIRAVSGFVMLATAGTALAQAPPALPRPAPAKPPALAKPVDPAFEAARTAFEALPESERKALQDALVWTGDYNSVISGTFARRVQSESA